MMNLEFVPNGKSEVMFEVINLSKLVADIYFAYSLLYSCTEKIKC